MDIRAITPADLDDVRALFGEYAASLPFDLGFQDFELELAGLPGAYVPPDGALLVARADGIAVGCVALRPLGPETCELKRLYVRPTTRGWGAGRALTERALGEARRIGYLRIRLDTLPGMERAQALYLKLGFRDVAPYRENPIAGARFLELEL
ncbi:MAG TPA: GNAT family N-acetyltransferase [Gaiellaceae bacterium]|nr:GNAT family N-acetyltransferase [Gaiellaceae bacterium]